MTKKEETKVVKNCLSKAEIDAKVKHDSACWLNIEVISSCNETLEKEIYRMVQQVTGRHGLYDGRIMINY